MNKIPVIILILFPFCISAQSFEPCADEAGSNAIHKDSSIILAWVNAIQLTRGFMDFQEPGFGYASFGMPEDALGPADGMSVVSLGDGGEAVLQFALPITNGPGPDFAVFENGFIDGYMEFAFVEVSSDGVNYVRFPATSEIPTSAQSSNFTVTECGYVNNLAGKYRSNYGTPFDLDELTGIEELNVNQITHVKLIDVIGIIDPFFGSTDQNGNLINDPYPTAFPSGGFDLDAVAVIHQGSLLLDRTSDIDIRVYPNPFHDNLSLRVPNEFEFILRDCDGRIVMKGYSMNEHVLDCSALSNGAYVLFIRTGGQEYFYRLIK